MKESLEYIDNELKEISVKGADVVHMFKARVEMANVIAEAKTMEATLKELQEKEEKEKSEKVDKKDKPSDKSSS